MKIYNYHEKTNEFLKQSDAIISPLEPNQFLYPAFSTDIAPPAINKNQVAVFKNNAWQIQPDFRGKIYWLDDGDGNIEKITIADIGDIIPKKAILTEPIAKIPSLKEFKTAVINQINQIAYQKSFDDNQIDYQNAYMQAKEILSKSTGQNIDDRDYPSVKIDVIVGTIDPRNKHPVKTLKQAAQLIIFTRNIWLNKIDNIRKTRKTANAAVKSATTKKQISDILTNIIWGENANI